MNLEIGDRVRVRDDARIKPESVGLEGTIVEFANDVTSTLAEMLTGFEGPGIWVVVEGYEGVPSREDGATALLAGMVEKVEAREAVAA